MGGHSVNLFFEISQFTAQMFVAGLWQGFVLISAVATCLRLLPRLTASIRFAIWGSAFALTIIMPLLHLQKVVVQHLSAPSAVVHLGIDWAIAIAFIWTVLMIGRSAQLLIQAIRLRRIWMRADPVAVDGAILELLQNGRRTAELCISADVDSPSVIGFFSPRLLIPEWLFAKLTPSELRQIVLHEREHLRRHDQWINLLQKMGLALFPLNPALLWVDRRLSFERELACDAGVVASTAAPFDYANCLTRLAEHRLHRRKVALSLSAWTRQSELGQRVYSLLQSTHKMSPLKSKFSVVMMSFVLVGGAVEMVRVPWFISFTDAAATSFAGATTAPQSPAVMQALPVSYRQAVQPHEMLLKAVMSPPDIYRVPQKLKPISRQPLQKKSSSSVDTRASQQFHVVLTTATQPAPKMQNHRLRSKAIRPIDAMPIGFSPSYAAVPFGDGWLIVQL